MAGVRNWNKAFGVKTLSELDGFDRQQSRFIAIGTSRAVAEDEFTTFGKAGALLRVRARKGSPGGGALDADDRQSGYGVSAGISFTAWS